ncbi:MAG TPA: nucleotide disphospho-sugar-binding domain-containing protein [Polyangiaceae bacterium]|nr:nucleotide disphospho-sugar-binding domain-containing protein [Polyangiaceae bacterium]
MLFVSEAITLAQVVRLAALAARVDRERYEVYFACGPFDEIALVGSGLEPLPLFTIDRRRALEKIERGERLYEPAVLERYVDEELDLFERVRPDLVIGDFRLSLAVSARLRGIPLATLINAYMSPFAERASFPVPDHPIVSLVGATRAARHWPKVLPVAFAHFVAPLESVRKRRGLTPSGGLLEALVDGDFTLYPDVPELCPTRNLPAKHRYLGPIPWSPQAAMVDLGPRFREDRPLVYVTIGSSGRYSALASVLQVVGDLPVNAVLATAGRFERLDAPANVHVVPFAPGSILARKASFVVTNGGASTSYQALAEGKPVLGIPSNLDQYLAMTAIERAGAGRLVRAGEATPRALRSAFSELLESKDLRQGARRVAAAFARADCHERFQFWLPEMLGKNERKARHEHTSPH